MGYDCRAILLFGYKININDYIKLELSCSRKDCSFINNDIDAYCSKCGANKIAITEEIYPKWTDKTALTTKNNIGVYKIYEEQKKEDQYYIGIVIGESKNFESVKEVPILLGKEYYEQELNDWIKENNIDVKSLTPKFYLNLYESY